MSEGCTNPCDCSQNIVFIDTTCPAPPPAYEWPYNKPYTGTEVPINTNWALTQANDPAYPFSLNPNYPLDTGSYASQVTTNTQAKTIFVSINNLQQQGGAFGANAPVFKSNQERLAYMQAQYAQAYYLYPKKGINTLYS